MATVSATEVRKRLYALIDEVGQSHEPVQITGKRGNAVLRSEDDWRAIQETLHLVSIPGMRESILAGMAREPRHCGGLQAELSNQSHPPQPAGAGCRTGGVPHRPRPAEPFRVGDQAASDGAQGPGRSCDPAVFMGAFPGTAAVRGSQPT
jgi:antitoxin YefM